VLQRGIGLLCEPVTQTQTQTQTQACILFVPSLRQTGFKV
jgi:hypothetical protein